MRAARRSAGLTQADLGQPDYTASYVSLLENGRRSPTRTVVERLAARLDVRPEQLDGAQWAPTLDAWAIWLPVEQKARRAWARGDYVEVRRLARSVVATIDASSDSALPVDFAARLLTVQTLLPLEAHAACAEEAHQLTAHPMARNSAELRSSLLSLASRAERADARLPEALASARAALAACDEGQVTDATRADALIVIISALADSGRLDDTEPVAAELADLADRLPDSHETGLAHWVLGNVSLLRGDIEAGLSAHRRADSLLSRKEDPRTYGRFLKASASQRLRASCLDDVMTLLAEARRWLELVGNQSDLAELAVTHAAALLALHRPTDALSRLNDLHLAENTPPLLVAESHEIAFKAHRELGDLAAARREGLAASRLLEDTGALPRAVQLLREVALLPPADLEA